MSVARASVHPMERRPTPDYSMLVVTCGEFSHQKRLDPPRPVLVTTRTYGGTAEPLVLEAVSTVRGYVCVRQSATGWPEWLAWVPARDVQPL